jgi:hypothetical protein
VRRPAVEAGRLQGEGGCGYPEVPVELPMFGQGTFAAGVLVADGVGVLAVSAALPDPEVDELPAA